MSHPIPKVKRNMERVKNALWDLNCYVAANRSLKWSEVDQYGIALSKSLRELAVSIEENENSGSH